MTPTEQKLLNALIACRDRFTFYVTHHFNKGDFAKASQNDMYVAMASEAIAAAYKAEPPNFCARCGKRLTPESVHTCTPPVHGERSQFAMLLQELEHLRMQAATAEKWRGLATAKFGDGRTVQEIQREAADEEREACAKLCEEAEIPFDIDVWMNSTKKEMTAATANALAAAIRARGQK